MRKSPRLRRLEADYRAVEELSAESSIFSFQANGDVPVRYPTRYRLQFRGPGISRDSRGKIQVIEQHEVIVELGASYPRMVPNLLWQSPVFHPNISNNGVVCLGGYGTHWVPSLTLDEMSTMLWDMIRYKNFDIQSPYNREAALWARDQRQFSLPLDKRSIRDLVNNPDPPENKELVEVEIVEEAGSANGKSVLGVLGALANRFRERPGPQESPEVARQEIIAEARSVEVIPVEESALIDPSEVEILEDGIAFLDSSDNNEAVASNESAENTGIVFLD